MNFSTVPPKRSSSLPQAGVVRSENRADVLRIEALRAGGRADEVGEDDGDHLALLALLDLGERRGALRAEAGVVRVLPAAVRTAQHRRESTAVERLGHALDGVALLLERGDDLGAMRLVARDERELHLGLHHVHPHALAMVPNRDDVAAERGDEIEDTRELTRACPG